MSDGLSVSIPALLKKTEHYDKDERYMATSDLCEVLKRQQQQYSNNPDAAGNNSAILDTSTERSICKAVLNLLHDKSHDVQAVAVKTLSVLLITVQEELVLEIEDSLTDQVLDASKTELRDVYAIGLRTLVKTVPASMGNKVAEKLVSRLLERGIQPASQVEEIILVSFDILTDLLQRFGGTTASVIKQHEPILQTCLTQLSGSPHAVVRKRAGSTMAFLSVVLSDALLMRMVESLLSSIDMAQGVGKAGRRKTRSAHSAAGTAQTHQCADTRALIRTMCAVSGQVGHRLGQQQIDRILPIFLRFTDPEDAVTGDDDDDQEMADDNNDAMDNETQGDAATALANELRESCFMGFESFLKSCPNEVEPHLEKIIQAALAYMAYDPNYSYGSDEIDAEQEDADDDYEDEDNEYDDEDDEEDDDDDDESWKVRRSAIRALRAVVQSKKHDPSMLWTTQYSIRRGKSIFVSEALVGRFKEREENCRVEIVDCFTLLLGETIQAAKAGILGFSGQDEMDTSSSGVSIDLRNEYAPKLVKACEKVLGVKKGNERSKSSALALLATLCNAPGGVGGQAEITSVFQHVQVLLSSTADRASHREGTSKALRLDGLSLVHAMLTSTNINPVQVRTSLRQTLLSEVCQAVKEQWYKVIAEALRAIAAVPKYFVVGFTSDTDDATKKKEEKDVADMLYKAIEPLLAAHDVDQEIKECALLACGAVLSWLHASLDKTKQDRLLQLLLERLKNETTRIAAIRTLGVVAAASRDDSMDDNRVDLLPILSESISVMSSFMKYTSRSLKQNALETLDIIVLNHGSHPELTNGELFSSLLQDLASLFLDSDLHLCHLSLRVAVSVMQVCPGAGSAVKAYCLEPALALSKSSLLQDHALDSVLDFFKQAVISEAVEFNMLLDLLRQRIGTKPKISKQGIYNLAKCIAIIASVTTPDNRQKLLNEIVSLLNEGEASAVLRQLQLSLLITGDLGRMIDLGQVTDVAERLKAIYLNYFEASSEELKSAAAYSLGNASVGSHSTFLPTIVSKLDEDNKKQQYLLLSALREFIQCSSRVSEGSGLASSLAMIVASLEKYCGAEEEGVRTMVAECMGCLSCVQPGMILPKLAEIQSDHAIINAPDGSLAEGDSKSKKNALVCWTVASSVKLAIAGKVDVQQLASYMPTFVQLLKQSELGVRNAALLMVYAAAKTMPKTIAPLLQDEIMPYLYEISELKLERKVDLGPFTHKVDDALPLRKATLSIFATCLENLPQNMDVSAFIPILVKALADAEDIQLHAHQIVISMISHHPSYIAASIDTFVEPLEKTINKKPGQKTGTELERMNDWIKSALRVMRALQGLEGSMNSRVFAEFVSRVKGNSKFQPIIQSLEDEQH